MPGVVLYDGPSAIDGAPIVAIAITGQSTNVKTGAMLQTYILRADMPPNEAVATGADASICGGCVHRRNPDTGARTCYVTLHHGPRSVWDCWARGGYDMATGVEHIATLGDGRPVRLGTYGDPAAVPAAIWRALISRAAGHTGYTHQWRSDRLASKLRGILQASCDTLQDLQRARAGGWGTFTVLPIGTAAPAGTIRCPASAEAGKVTTCADCRMCDGGGRHIVIDAHGAQGKKYTGGRRLPREREAYAVYTPYSEQVNAMVDAMLEGRH